MNGVDQLDPRGQQTVQNIQTVLTLVVFVGGVGYVASQFTYGWTLLLSLAAMLLVPLGIDAFNKLQSRPPSKSSEARASEEDEDIHKKLLEENISNTINEASEELSLPQSAEHREKSLTESKEITLPEGWEDRIEITESDLKLLSPTGIDRVQRLVREASARSERITKSRKEQHAAVQDIWLEAALSLATRESLRPAEPPVDLAERSTIEDVKASLLKRFPYISLGTATSQSLQRLKVAISHCRKYMRQPPNERMPLSKEQWESYALPEVQAHIIDESSFAELAAVYLAHPDLFDTPSGRQKAAGSHRPGSPESQQLAPTSLQPTSSPELISSEIFKELVQDGIIDGTLQLLSPRSRRRRSAFQDDDSVRVQDFCRQSKWKALGPGLELILSQARVFERQENCDAYAAEWKYKCDRVLDEQAASLAFPFQGLNGYVYAHIRAGFGDLGAAVTNACFLRGMGFTIQVVIGGNYDLIPPDILSRFEAALGSRVISFPDLMESRVTGHHSSENLNDKRVHMVFDTYTKIAGDNDVIEALMACFPDPKPLRFSMSEFGFSPLQEWGRADAPPSEFSMGLSTIEIGIPMANELIEAYAHDQNDLTVESLRQLKLSDQISYFALLHNVTESLSEDTESSAVNLYVQEHLLFAGYGHQRSSVVGFILTCASLGADYGRAPQGTADQEQLQGLSELEDARRKNVDICLCSSRVTEDDVMDILRYFGPQLLKPGWYDRLVVQGGPPSSTSASDISDRYSYNVVLENLPPENGGRTFRVIRQGMKLTEMLKLSHPFALCTGDSTLAEYISSQKAFCYDTLPHKVENMIALLGLCHQLDLPHYLELLTAFPCDPYPKKTVMQTILSMESVCQRALSGELAAIVNRVVRHKEHEKLFKHVNRHHNIARRKQGKLNRMALLKQAESLIESEDVIGKRIEIILRSLSSLERDLYHSKGEDDVYMAQCAKNYAQYLKTLANTVSKTQSGLSVVDRVYAIACANEWSQSWLSIRQAHLSYPGTRAALNQP